MYSNTLTKLIFVGSTLLSVYLYDQVHRLTVTTERIALLKIPLVEEEQQVYVDDQGIGLIKSQIFNGRFKTEANLNLSLDGIHSQWKLNSNVAFTKENQILASTLILTNQSMQLEVNIDQNQSPNTEFIFIENDIKNQRALDLPIQLEGTSRDGFFLVSYQQSSPILTEILGSLLSYMLAVNKIQIKQDYSSATKQHHLNLDRLVSFIKGELFTNLKTELSGV